MLNNWYFDEDEDGSLLISFQDKVVVVIEPDGTIISASNMICYSNDLSG